MRLRVCCISPGVVHAVPRTLAIAPFLDEVQFLDTAGTADRRVLEAHGVRYVGPAPRDPRVPPLLAFQRLLRQINPDVICVHYGLGDHFFGAIAYGRCPVAVIAMGSDVLHEAGDLHVPATRRWLSRTGFRLAGYVAAKSRYLARELERMGVKGPVPVNYWGTDLSRFSPQDRSAARARIGLRPGVKIVLSPRAIEPRYNPHLIVGAFPVVLRRWPDALLIIAGRSQPDSSVRLRELIDSLGLRESVRFVGELAQDDLAAHYCASDLVVSVARSEGFPNTLLEVMACEVPILAGDIPQIRELLDHGVNATICTLDEASVAARMLDVLEDPVRAARLAAAARGTARRVGDIGRNGEMFALQLGELVKGHREVATGSLLRYRAVYAGHAMAKLPSRLATAVAAAST